MPSPKPPPRQKSPTSIEVWRHEVSESALPPSSPSSPSPSPELKRQPSFWKKILPSHSRSSTTVEPHVQINGHAVQEGGSSKLHTNKRKGSDTPEPGVRTAMYNKAYSNRSRLKDMSSYPQDGSNPQEARDEGLLGVEEEEDGQGGSSMEIASGDSDEVGGLKDKMERLERARRLLEGKGRGNASGGGGRGNGRSAEFVAQATYSRASRKGRNPRDI
ncbi:hypothetical protein B0J14DRAFT_564914 [Halenospora varia]|nr:hypothetical protein B0J14DRAFT_564914 [Halenospora varia]